LPLAPPPARSSHSSRSRTIFADDLAARRLPRPELDAATLISIAALAELRLPLPELGAAGMISFATLAEVRLPRPELDAAGLISFVALAELRLPLPELGAFETSYSMFLDGSHRLPQLW
jgi:hypothetical protein